MCSDVLLAMVTVSAQCLEGFGCSSAGCLGLLGFGVGFRNCIDNRHWCRFAAAVFINSRLEIHS